jgi:hypothetical protein
MNTPQRVQAALQTDCMTSTISQQRATFPRPQRPISAFDGDN